MTKIKRKLTTILATDCVGFSRHMEESEELTLRNLNACRAIIDPIIDEYGGRIFHTAGDSVIADFSSTVECVKAAIEFQQRIADCNEKVETGPKLLWRIGIHLDDVIMEKDNVFGSGVNIAARLESQCNTGQILVSRIVADQVRKRIDLPIHAAGTRVLKNISDDFEVFSISPCGDQIPETVEETKNKPAALKNRRHKLAVLPFTNRNRDEDSGFLVDGIVEDLITEFSMIKELEIVSRQTSFDFRERNQDLQDFVNNFEIDYIVNGGIRSSGKRIRISVELSEAIEGKVIWSKKYDRIMEDIFDVQDEIVRKISIPLIGEIELSSLKRAKRKPTENMTSYEFLLRGKEMHHRFDEHANKAALEMFDNAIKADSSNSNAYAWKACTIGQGMMRGYIKGDMGAIWGEGMKLLDKAIELNENDFECHRLFAEVYLSAHEFDKAYRHARTSNRMNPNDPRVLSVYGETMLRVGKRPEGLKQLEKAYALDPIPQGQSSSDKRIAALINGYFMTGQYHRCSDLMEELQTVDKRSWLLRTQIAIANGESYLTERWYSTGRKEFSKLDWKHEIDRFHLNDLQLEETLNSLAATLGK